jgi:site-specific recombinase XerD
VPLDLHAHQVRHAKASHWLEDGMNIVQISFLLGHEQLETTMKYLDITIEQEADALATLEDEHCRTLPKKWKANDGCLAAFCGVKQMKL